jgi:hypothetical protein
MTTIEEQERQAYMVGDIDRAGLLAQIFDLLQRVEKAEKLLNEALEYIEDGAPPSPSGDWAQEVRGFLNG